MERFYPSCNFARIDAVTAKKLIMYAKDKGYDIAQCCLVDKTEGTEDDTAYYICQACRPNIEKQHFHSESFWKIFDEDESFVFPDYHDLTVVIQDCWRDREHPEIFDYVRSLLAKMHVNCLELAENRENSGFCGRFHVNTVKYKDELAKYPDVKLLTELPDGLYEKLMAEQVAKYPCKYALTYCNTCYNSVKAGGGHPIHLAQLLMGTWREE